MSPLKQTKYELRNQAAEQLTTLNACCSRIQQLLGRIGSGRALENVIIAELEREMELLRHSREQFQNRLAEEFNIRTDIQQLPQIFELLQNSPGERDSDIPINSLAIRQLEINVAKTIRLRDMVIQSLLLEKQVVEISLNILGIETSTVRYNAAGTRVAAFPTASERIGA